MKSPISNNSINAIKDVRKLFNELRSNLSTKETKRIRKKTIKRKPLVIFLKQKRKVVL